MTDTFERLKTALAETLAARSRTTFVAPIDFARWFAAAGEHDRALDSLERRFAQRDPDMPHVGVMRPFDSLRDDRRFQDLLRLMKPAAIVSA